jgi:hypothetical protein
MCLKAKIKEMGGFVSFITGGWASAITLAPFGIYVKKDYLPPYWDYKRLENHESIHWAQQMEMIVAGAIIAAITVGILLLFGISSWWLLTSLAFLFLFFYLWYVIEWFIRIFINGSKAYKSLCFEREAYQNDDNLDYLKTRKRFSFLKYIFGETLN